jgi:hypothetical protein
MVHAQGTSVVLFNPCLPATGFTIHNNQNSPRHSSVFRNNPQPGWRILEINLTCTIWQPTRVPLRDDRPGTMPCSFEIDARSPPVWVIFTDSRMVAIVTMLGKKT